MDLAQAELAVFMFMIAFTYILHSARYSAACAMVDAQLSQKNEGVVHRLLSGMCDAVVHIDHDFVIQQLSPKLETLLLKPASAKGLVGTPFPDL